MIRFNHVTFTYPGATAPALVDVTAVVGPGELGLVMGLTGSGKTTLLRLVNGLVPHFSGGQLLGSVQVGALDTRHAPPRNMASLVGYVGQDPAAGFVTDQVEDELAYAMEQHALDRNVMRARVEEVTDLLGITDLRQRPVSALSAGQAQRVAMAAALTLRPAVLVLDEPTSALDPAAAEEVMAAVSRLVHDLDMTVLMAEHRLERVVQFADLALHISPAGHVTCGDVRSVLASSDVAPPIVRLAKRLDWPTTPLTVREARRLASAGPAPTPGATKPPVTSEAPVALHATGLTVRYPGGIVALDNVDLTLRAGQVTGLMGRNGSGKTSLLWALQGQGPPGAIRQRAAKTSRGPAGRRTAATAQANSDSATQRSHQPPVALVPAQPTDLFWANTVAAEVGSGLAKQLLTELAPDLDPQSHPRDLSEGQRLELALAIQLASNAPVVALDEPTRGLDYQAKDRLAHLLQQLANQGRAVLVASHDVEFLALVAKRVVWLACGQVIADGPAQDLLTAVPAHAPQMAKVFAPARVLTVDQACAAVVQP